MSKRKIFAFIDPGPEKDASPSKHGSALVIWDGEKILYKSKGIRDNLTGETPLLSPSGIQDILISFIKHGVFIKVGIEMIASYGMPVGKEVFSTCLVIGELRHRLNEIGFCVDLIYRKDIKLHLCGSPRAKDSNISQALKDRYGKPGTKKFPNEVYQDGNLGPSLSGDGWAAFAGAVYLHDKFTEGIV